MKAVEVWEILDCSSMFDIDGWLWLFLEVLDLADLGSQTFN